jgi:hypothetical protein
MKLALPPLLQCRHAARFLPKAVSQPCQFRRNAKFFAYTSGTVARTA